MNAEDLKRLQAHRGFPALSLRVPTHRTMPEVIQDPTRLKNAIRQAVQALKAHGVAAPVVHDYTARLERFQRDLDFRHLDRGLCVFVAPGFLEWHTVSHEVDEAVVIDETFLTRDLVRTLNRQPLYDLLVLSEKTTRFFRGQGSRLTEDEDRAFPMSSDQEASSSPGGFSKGVDPKGHHNERLRVFLRRVAQEVEVRRQPSRRPLFLAGVDRLRSFYQEVSGSDHVAGHLEGSFDHVSLHSLHDSLQPAVKGWLRNRRQQVLERFDETKGTRHGLIGLQEIGEAATLGRVDTLLVEEPYTVPGSFDRTTGRITEHPPGNGAAAPGDVVDEIVETVLEKGGEVVFYRDGRLAQASAPPMGAILRY